MDISSEIKILRRDLLIQRSKNEYVKLLIEQQKGNEIQTEKITELETILKTHNNSIRLDYDKFMSSLDDVNEMYMVQSWNKMHEFNKIRKIMEYFNENVHDNIDDTMKKNICDDLIKLIKLKKLNKKNEIVYDKELKKIISIPILKINNDDKTYYIKVKQTSKK